MMGRKPKLLDLTVEVGQWKNPALAEAEIKSNKGDPARTHPMKAKIPAPWENKCPGKLLISPQPIRRDRSARNHALKRSTGADEKKKRTKEPAKVSVWKLKSFLLRKRIARDAKVARAWIKSPIMAISITERRAKKAATMYKWVLHSLFFKR